MARYEVWTHGADTVVEFPTRATEIRHAGFGTQVRQPAGSTNWFHFALPAITVIDGRATAVREIRLRATANENARIDILHFRIDGRPLSFARNVSFTDRTVNEAIQIADTPAVGGLVLSVHATFLDGSTLGSVVFQGAGVVLLT